MAVHTQPQAPQPITKSGDPVVPSRTARAPQDSRSLARQRRQDKLEFEKSMARTGQIKKAKRSQASSRSAEHAAKVMAIAENLKYRLVEFHDLDLKLAIPDSFALKGPEAQRRELRKMVAEVQDIASKPVPVKKAETAVATKGKVLPGWKKLMEKSLRGQAQTLQSEEFLSVAEAAPLLGVEDAAVRRRIREGKLLALKHPSGGEHRVPIWATGISSADTKALTDLGGDSPWDLYQFMEAPHGAMKALRPCDLLVAPEHLPAGTRRVRDALAASLKTNGTTLLALVMRALKEHVSREA